jgi:hypothetical protein
MFVCGGCCKKCLYDERCFQQIGFKSYGKCEICGKVDVCFKCGRFTRKGKTVKQVMSADVIKFAVDNLCPANCRFISPTEEKQSELRNKNNYVPHSCMKFNKTIYHGVFHPRLVKCEECKEGKS